MARQNMTVAATVATSLVLSVGFVMPTPGAYTFYNIYARTRAIVSPMTEGVAMKFFLTLKPWKISKMTTEIATNLDFLAPAYKKNGRNNCAIAKKGLSLHRNKDDTYNLNNIT